MLILKYVLPLFVILSLCNCSTLNYKETISETYANLRISLKPPEIGDEYRIVTWLYKGESLEQRMNLGKFTVLAGKAFPPVINKSKLRKVPTDEKLSIGIEARIISNDTYYFRHDILFTPLPNKIYEVEIEITDKFPIGKYNSFIYEINAANDTRSPVESVKSKCVDIPLKLDLPASRILSL